MHAGVLADDGVPRGLDGEDLLSAEKVSRVEEAAHSAQASAEIVIHIERTGIFTFCNKCLGMYRIKLM